MRVLPSDPSCYLIELADMERDPLPEPIRENHEAVAQIVAWAREYLSQPHPDLGRDGSVCPYVPYSMISSLFFLTVQRGRDLTQSDVYDTIMKYRDWFLAIEPREGPESRYKTILVLFPDVPTADAPQIIDATQALLKPGFVEKGLMIGQFHPLPPIDPGLWNPDFRPLRSPVPLLAMRHLVANDLPFLTMDRRFVASYFALHGHNIPRKYRATVRELAQTYGLELPAAMSNEQ